MNQNPPKQENKMGTQPINTLLVGMAVPLMISMLVQALYNIVDSIYVSRVSEAALTAVSAAFPIQTIMVAISSGTGVGMNAMLSRSLGEKKFREADRAANNGVFLALCSYLVFVLVGLLVSTPFYMSQYPNSPDISQDGILYMTIVCCFSIGFSLQMTFERMMQGTGLTFYTMLTQTTGAVLNIILDPMFIFGIGPFPELGTAGAAVATCIGQCTAGLFAMVMNHVYNKEIHVSLSQVFHPSWSVIKRIYYVGIPSTIMGSIGSIMYYGMNRLLTGFTDTASAVFGVYFKLQSFFFMPIFGMNNAIVPIMAYNYGAQKRSRMIKCLTTGIKFAICIMCLGTLTFELIPNVLLGFFNASDNMQEIGRLALRIIGIHFPVAAVCIVLGTTFQALGKATYSACISLGRQLVVLLPAAYVLSRVGGLDAIWWAFPIAEGMSLALTLLFFLHIYRNIILKVEDRV